jgi:hypothetical protein
MGAIKDYDAYAKGLFDLLDKYLIKDFATLVDDVPARPGGGGVGYPVLQTILSGMELLGLLLCGARDSKAFISGSGTTFYHFSTGIPLYRVTVKYFGVRVLII